jgi:hypothetical protein
VITAVPTTTTVTTITAITNTVDAAAAPSAAAAATAATAAAATTPFRSARSLLFRLLLQLNHPLENLPGFRRNVVKELYQLLFLGFQGNLLGGGRDGPAEGEDHSVPTPKSDMCGAHTFRLKLGLALISAKPAGPCVPDHSWR